MFHAKLHMLLYDEKTSFELMEFKIFDKNNLLSHENMKVRNYADAS